MTPIDLSVLDCCTTPAIHATMPFVVASHEGWTLLRCRCGQDWAHSTERAPSRPDQLVEWFTPLASMEVSGAGKLGPAMDYRSLRSCRRSLRVCDGVATWTG
jgi:hypothetical protein